ncbi:uncharacterized protein LOC144099924 [Amblyomma americanum]
MPIILSSAASGHAQFLFVDRPALSFGRSVVCLATPPNSSVLACAAEKSLGFCLESSGRNMDSAKRAPGWPPVSEHRQGRGSCHGNCGRYVDSAKRPPVSQLQQRLVVWVRSYDSERGEQGGGDGHCQRDPRQRPPRLHARVSAQPGRAVSCSSIHHHWAFKSTAYPPAPQDALTGESREGPLPWACRVYSSVGSVIVCSAQRLCCHHHQGSGRAPTGRTGRKAHTGHGTR